MEKIEINKELYNDLIELLKECANEGNCFAAMIKQKHNIE